MGASGKDLVGSSPGDTAFKAWSIAGGSQQDASIEYRQVQESRGPYVPKAREVSGAATVGESIIPDLGKPAEAVAAPAEDSSHR